MIRALSSMLRPLGKSSPHQRAYNLLIGKRPRATSGNRALELDNWTREDIWDYRAPRRGRFFIGGGGAADLNPNERRGGGGGSNEKCVWELEGAVKGRG